MRTATYARVSTDKQAEKYGLASQVEALRQRCSEKSWEVVSDDAKDAFIDDGYSGAELDRPALNRLRQAVREGQIDVVLAYDPDRLSRKLVHLMLLAEEFEKNGAKLEFITQEMGGTPENKMLFGMRGVIAEYEREKIRERTLRGSRQKAKQGKVVNAAATPFGYRYNKETATLEENPDTAPIIRLIFQSYANENVSLLKLAERLNRLRIATPRGGNRWRASTLGIMLRNEAYVGNYYQFRSYRIEPARRLKTTVKSKKSTRLLRPREEWLCAKIPALIPVELFEAVQRKLKTNAELSKRNTKRQYLLSGLLFCSWCGGRMGGHNMHGVTYYYCRRRHHPDKIAIGPDGRPQPCTCPEVKTETVEQLVWQTITELIKNPELLLSELHRSSGDGSAVEVQERELKLCRSRLKAIPQEQRRLVQGYRKGLYADFMMREEMAALQKEQGELEKREAELEKRLSRRLLSQNHEADLKTLLEQVSSGLDNLDFSGRQDLLRLLIERVVYAGDKVEIGTIIPLDTQLHPIQRGGHRG